jgi:chromosome segregation ATPase
MTSSRYYLARFAQAFGYQRKNQRMGDAASEMHLLREAEAELGLLIWRNVEPIEELSVEYWNLRKFFKEREEVQKNLAICQARLEKAHEERVVALSQTPETHQELVDQRADLLEKLEDQAKKRDEIVAEARDVRRSYEGMKMKFDVISKESASSDEIAKINAQLVEIRDQFANLKQQRLDIGKAIEDSDAKLDAIEKELDEKKKNFRINASEAFQVIGDGNKEMAIYRAESSVLETQMRQLYGEIGRFVSRNAHHHPGCAKAAESHRGLVEIMRAIRRSIALNHRLAGTA